MLEEVKKILLVIQIPLMSDSSTRIKYHIVFIQILALLKYGAFFVSYIVVYPAKQSSTTSPALLVSFLDPSS